MITSMATKNHDPLALPLTHLKGVGTQLAAKLERLSLYTVSDLLFHLPRCYQDRTRTYAIAELVPGMFATIEAEVVKQQLVLGKRRRLEIELADRSGYLYMSLFHFSTPLRQHLPTGTRLRCFGEVSFFANRLQMVHPEYEKMTAPTPETVVQTLTPVYPSTEGISQKTWHNLMAQALKLVNDSLLMDYLPATASSGYTLVDALNYCHHPPQNADLALLEAGSHPAQQRLSLEELLAHHLSLRLAKQQIKTLVAPVLQCDPAILEKFYQHLPFTPTQAQLRVLQEIFADFKLGIPMLRLLQGDVGSGKTLVAAGSMLAAISQGYQTALMVPTELLATQHGLTLARYFSVLSINIVVLHSRMPAKQKQAVYQQIKTGDAQVVIGTHALIQEAVEFQQLGLVIIDEQHRFGVKQRLQLQAKSAQAVGYAHQLIMTATPIPRTLAMTFYADLDYSVLDELPPHRKPITTVALANSRRNDIIAKVREFIASKQQAYWICTLIDESELLTSQAAIATYDLLQTQLPEFKIGLVHGQLKTIEKQAIMDAFKSGELHLLVATTVIEVGVDVPNASLMIIENAERLGLAQLHQLRGRVGRGTQASHCILMYRAPLSWHAKARLDILRKTCDGFKIAEHDLKLRGSGEFLGTRQSGELNFKVLQLTRDHGLMARVTELAEQLLKDHPEFIAPLIARWLKEKVQYSAV